MPAREIEVEGRAREATSKIPDINPSTRLASKGVPSRSQAESRVEIQAFKPTGGRMLPGSRNDLIAISKITPALVRSPVYKLTLGLQKDFTPLDWLEIEAEFSVHERVPDIATFRFEVRLNGSLLAGDIPVAPLEKGQGLLTVAYISPNSLRLASRGREPDFNSAQIKVTVISGGNTIGEASYEKGNPSGPIKQELEDAVRAKPDTPFAPLYWDRYVELATAPHSETTGITR